MKRCLFFFLVFLLGAHSLAAESKLEIAQSELALGSVSLSDPESEVKKRLGEPVTRIDTGEGYLLRYQGIEILLDAHGVFEMKSTAPKYCTPSRICPGMPVKNLVARFGPGILADRESGKFLEYIPRDGACWLQINESSGAIASIRVACQP